MAEVEEARLDINCQNPLLINEIAERILQFVPVRHLKACRLVCQLWWKESLARWRRTYWLQLSTYDFNSGRLANFHQRSDDKLDFSQMRKCLHTDLYMAILEDPLDPYKLQTQPFQKLKLFKSRLVFDSEMNDKLKRFLTTRGHSVMFLVLEKCSIGSAKDFCRLIFRFSHKLEYLSLSGNVYKKTKRRRKNQLENLNLEALVSKQSDVQSHLKYLKLGKVLFDTIPDDSLPLTWTKLFAHFPNIQNLEFLTLDDKPGKADIHGILQSIHALRTQCGILQQIRGLDILNLEDLASDFSVPALRDRLLDVSLPLTFFAYDIGFEPICVLDHKLQLGISATTLETLVIYKGPYSAPFDSFPFGNKFPKLTKLTLVGPIVNDLQFLNEMPALRTVRLFHEPCYEHEKAAIWRPKVIKQLQTFRKDNHEGSYDVQSVAEVPVIGNTDFSKLSHLSFPNIEEFLIGEERCTAEHVEQLARLIPNLKRLRIGLDNEGFRAVCKDFKRLEALDINPVHLNEEGITGIVPGEETRHPNITDLKYLKAFGMDGGAAEKSEEESRFSDLTDLSVEQGLLKLKYLERVVVWCSMKMSKENYRKLKSRFPPYPYSAIYRDQYSDKYQK